MVNSEGLSSITALTRVSTSDTSYGTRASTSDTQYGTRASTSGTNYGTRASTSGTNYGTISENMYAYLLRTYIGSSQSSQIRYTSYETSSFPNLYSLTSSLVTNIIITTQTSPRRTIYTSGIRYSLALQYKYYSDIIERTQQTGTKQSIYKTTNANTTDPTIRSFNFYIFRNYTEYVVSQASTTMAHSFTSNNSYISGTQSYSSVSYVYDNYGDPMSWTSWISFTAYINFGGIKTTGTTYLTRSSTSGTTYLTRSSTSGTTYLTRTSTSGTTYLTRSSTSGYSGVSSSTYTSN